MIWTLLLIVSAWASEPIVLKPGFVRKLHCEGRLYLSSVGNPALVELQPLPRELGCGVIVRPLAGSGETDLILETSTGTISRVIEIRVSAQPVLESDLNPGATP
jgi:hypothetical protein